MSMIISYTIRNAKIMITNFKLTLELLSYIREYWESINCEKNF